MFVIRLFVCLVAAATIPLRASASSPPVIDLPHGPHIVGYRTLRVEDRARSFGPHADQPLWRPMQIHIWYPARETGAPAMSYEDYAAAQAPVGQPIDSPLPSTEQARDAWKARPLRRGADEALLDAVLDLRTRAHRDADPVERPCPLIAYSPSINSDPMENALLFEYLTSWGSIVAAAPSMGQYEADVSRDAVGARTQVEDLKFVLARMLNDPGVQADKVGLLGFSWGGMAALLTALEHRGISAIAALDGGMRFPDYQPVAASFPCWKGRNLRAALSDVALDDEPRTPSLGDDAPYADVYTWTQPGLQHADFAWDMVARYRWATGDPDQPEISTFYNTLARRLKTFFDAYVIGDAHARADLRQTRSGEGAVWTTAIGLEPPPAPAHFTLLVEEQGVQACADLVHALRETDPQLVPFEEDRLLEFAYAWGPDRADDLLVLLRLNLEVYPQSAATYFWLGQVHLAREDSTEAISALQQALALDQRMDRARRLLTTIGGTVPDNDQQLVRHVVEDLYVEGLRTRDVELLRQACLPIAVLRGVRADSTLITTSLERCFQDFDSPGPSFQRLDSLIESVEVTGNAAQVRLRLMLDGQRTIHELLQLLKVGGKWRLAHIAES